MVPTNGMKTLAPEQFYGHAHSRCCYEPEQTSTQGSSSLAEAISHVAGSRARSPSPARAHPLTHARHSEYAIERLLANVPGVGAEVEERHPPQPGLDEHGTFGSIEELSTCLDSQKHTTRGSQEGKADHFSVNELFSLLKTANELDIYGAPHGQSTARWEQVRGAHEANGYKRSTKSVRTKLEELLHYHMDPDSKKVTKALREQFKTEGTHVRFGAPLDELKHGWEKRKAPDSEKIKEQKIREENEVGGAVLRDAALATIAKRRLLAAPNSEPKHSDDPVADNDCVSNSNEKENKPASPHTTVSSKKRKSIDLTHSDGENEDDARKKRRSRLKEPRFNWKKHFEDERESQRVFQEKLMERLDEGNRYNKEAITLMKDAQSDNRSFQFRLLDILERKLS